MSMVSGRASVKLGDATSAPIVGQPGKNRPALSIYPRPSLPGDLGGAVLAGCSQKSSVTRDANNSRPGSASRPGRHNFAWAKARLGEAALYMSRTGCKSRPMLSNLAAVADGHEPLGLRNTHHKAARPNGPLIHRQPVALMTPALPDFQ